MPFRFHVTFPFTRLLFPAQTLFHTHSLASSSFPMRKYAKRQRKWHSWKIINIIFMHIVNIRILLLEPCLVGFLPWVRSWGLLMGYSVLSDTSIAFESYAVLVHLHTYRCRETLTKTNSFSLLFWNLCRFKCECLPSLNVRYVWKCRYGMKEKNGGWTKKKENKVKKRAGKMWTVESNKGWNIYFMEQHIVQGNAMGTNGSNIIFIHTQTHTYTYILNALYLFDR